MRDILTDLNKWLQADERIALATVIQTWGSSPRSTGARMAITPGGLITGSVSGGCVEAAVYEAGVEILESGIPRLLHFGVADETAWQVGLACGGTLEVFVEPLDRLAFGHMQTALAGPRPVADITVIRGPQELLGREIILTRDGKLFGDLEPALESAALEAAGRALTGRRSGRHILADAPQVVEIFVDVLLPPPTLVVVGGVHIALALTSIARILGYRTVIIDPRGAFGSAARFAHADRLIQAWPEEAFPQIEALEETAVCVLSHDPKIDDPALTIALNGRAFYVGALGSRATQDKRRRRLLEAGLTAAQLARLHAPIGLEIGAQTPEEIALAIMAEVVRARHGMHAYEAQR